MKFRATNIAVAGAALMLSAAAPAAERLPAPGELAAIFEAYRTDQAVLAPDGQHLAYTVRNGRKLSLAMADLDHPENRATWVLGEDATAGFFQRRVTGTAQLTFLRWADAGRLVYGLSLPGADRNGRRDEIRIVNIDGRNDHKVVDGQDLKAYTLSAILPRLPRALDFAIDDPQFLFVEALGGGVIKSELFKVDLNTGKFQSVNSEEDWNPETSRYLYDRQGHARIKETPPFYTGISGSPFNRSVSPNGPEDAGGGGEMPEPPGGLNSKLAMSHEPVHVPVPQVYRYRPSSAYDGYISKFFGTDWIHHLDGILGADYTLSFRVTAKNYYAQRSFPIAFGADPEVLYIASNVGRDTYGIYGLNLRTKQRTEFAVENPGRDLVDPGDAFSEEALVFNRKRQVVGIRLAAPDGNTRWFDPGLARRQRTIDALFGGRRVEILDWNETQQRVLAFVSGPNDPGRYFLYDEGAAPTIIELLRRAPGLRAELVHRSLSFAFDTPAGVHLMGTLTLPRRSRITPVPLVVICQDIPGSRETPGFDRPSQALAAMGFAVAKVNYRGSAGFGAHHRDAARDGFDRVPLEDIRATVAWITARHAINPKRVALLGEGFGGFIALRGAQLFPDDFRCAVSINGPSDPIDWLYQPVALGVPTQPSMEIEVRQVFFERSRLANMSVVDHLAPTMRPVLIVQDPTKSDLQPSQGPSLRNAMKRRGLEVEYMETNSAFSRGDPDARTRVFTQIAGFLNDFIYDFRVDLGETKEVK